MSLPRRNLLQSIGAAGLLGLAGPREQQAQEAVARATRGMPAPRIKDIGVIESQPAGVRLTVVKIIDRSGRPLRLRLRHFHAARRPGEARRGEVPEAVPARQDHGSDRRYLAILLRQLLLEERPGAEQRHQRRRPGAVGYQGPAGGHAGLSAGGRQMPGGRRCLRARGWRRVSRTWSRAAKRFMAQGFRNVRVQVGVPGMAGYGAGPAARRR